jgi:hypothetical protein
MSRFLHRVALGNPWIAEASFDLEQALLRPGPVLDEEHVFVCGLARAGTTILMRMLYETQEFHTLTYRHMPFVLMPGLWRRLSTRHRKFSSLSERAHGDGILVGFDSPEAFEEVFWITYCSPDYVKHDHLSAHNPDTSEVASFKRFLGSVMASAGGSVRRYLSKNNNNLLRLPILHRQFQKSSFLVPFRNPLQHSQSLLQQHVRFSMMQRNDPFVLEYMKWLGHYEFGAGHLPFFQPVRSACAPDRVDYWLQLWIQVYERVMELDGGRIFFICFEDLCNRPADSIDELWSRISLVANRPAIALREPPVVDVVPEEGLRRKAIDIFLALKERTILNA